MLGICLSVDRLERRPRDAGATASSGCERVIRKLLVANRGEIARRVMRSARDWASPTVAVFSDPDAVRPARARGGRGGASFRAPPPSETYLAIGPDQSRPPSASGADAVHPGYGFLSENAAFARRCAMRGSPSSALRPDVIDAMGSKLAAKAMMAAAGVPVLPTIEVEWVPGLPRQSSPRKPSTGSQTRADVGFPLLVKASARRRRAGDAGRRGSRTLGAAVESARREASSAFGDGTLFVEPYARRPRHIEVQIVGDTHGNVVHLFERECSIQRRHQKIVEESPSPALDDATRARPLRGRA